MKAEIHTGSNFPSWTLKSDLPKAEELFPSGKDYWSHFTNSECPRSFTLLNSHLTKLTCILICMSCHSSQTLSTVRIPFEFPVYHCSQTRLRWKHLIDASWVRIAFYPPDFHKWMQKVFQCLLISLANCFMNETNQQKIWWFMADCEPCEHPSPTNQIVTKFAS